MIRQLRAMLIAAAVVTATLPLASAQDKGSVDPKPLPPLAHPDDPGEARADPAEGTRLGC